MNQTILDALTFVHKYASDVDDWIVIKKELLKALHPRFRVMFSTRDPVTKKQVTNDFERLVAEHWSRLTGRPVIFTSDEQAPHKDSP